MREKEKKSEEEGRRAGDWESGAPPCSSDFPNRPWTEIYEGLS